MILSCGIALFLALASMAYSQSADILQSEAEAMLRAGDYAGALRQSNAAAKAFEASGDKPNQGRALNTAGAAALHGGDYSNALRLMEASLALARQSGQTDLIVTRQNNIAGLHSMLGNYEEAYARYQDALRSIPAKPASGTAARDRQLTLTNLAILYLQVGQNRRALDLYQEILAAPFDFAPSVRAQMLTNLAICYRRLGDPQKALATYKTARELLSADPDATASQYALRNIGIVQALDFQDYGQAIETFRHALKVARNSGNKREVVQQRLFLGETLFRMKRYAEARSEFEGALQGATALKLTDEQWTALYGLGRVDRVEANLDSAAKRFDAAIGVIESERSRIASRTLKDEFLASRRDVYDASIELLLGKGAPAAVAAEKILGRMEQSRARNLKELLPAGNQAISIPAIQRQLKPGTGLIEYWVSDSVAAAVYITSDDAGVVKAEISQTDLLAVQELIAALGQRDSTNWRALARQVSARFGISRLPIHQTRQWFIVADGILNRIPFEVLEHEGKLLIEKAGIAYLPSAHLLPEQADANMRRRRWPWELTMSAFADPRPDGGGGKALFDSTLPRLAYSDAEARAASSALPGAARLHTGADNLRRHVAIDAAAGVSVFHFATHASVDMTDSRRSRLVFTPESGDPSSGYLLAPDIGRLRMSGAELVTLAACDTEQGSYIRGEGVESFSRAFLAAGAKATVSSLWRVSDNATSQLMAIFYSELGSGLPKTAALREAKLAFLRSGGNAGHPYYWAAFVLTGDGTVTLPAVWTWTQVSVAAVAVLAIVAAALRLIRSRAARKAA